MATRAARARAGPVPTTTPVTVPALQELESDVGDTALKTTVSPVERLTAAEVMG